MLCQYCKIISFQENPVCTLDEQHCFKVRPCSSELRWKPFGDTSKCRELKEKEAMKLFKDEYKVRFVKKNKLYIEIPEENCVITLENLYDFEPTKVKLVQDQGKK